MANQDPGIMLNVRIAPEIIDRIDEKVKELTASFGTPFNRTDVCRMALARFLGLIDVKPEQSDSP